MSVDIPSEYLPFVKKAVASGRYQSEEAVIGQALKLLSEQEELRQTIRQGFDQISRGECLELDEEELDDYFEALIHRAEERASAKRAG